MRGRKIGVRGDDSGSDVLRRGSSDQAVFRERLANQDQVKAEKAVWCWFDGRECALQRETGMEKANMAWCFSCERLDKLFFIATAMAMMQNFGIIALTVIDSEDVCLDG